MSYVARKRRLPLNRGGLLNFYAFIRVPFYAQQSR